jgi:hypothetical protein
MTAFFEENLWVSFLKVFRTDLCAWDVRGDREYRHTIAMAIEKSVDEMQVPRSATPGADRERAGDGGIGACSERRDFFVTHRDPLDSTVRAQGVGNPVQGVADQPIDSANARRVECFYYSVGDGSHRQAPWLNVRARLYALPAMKSVKGCKLVLVRHPSGYRQCRSGAPGMLSADS